MVMQTPRKPELTLSDYPHEIAKLRTAIARLDRQIASMEYAIARIDLTIENTVASNRELKNDTQRRVKRGELRGFHPELRTHQEQLTRAREKRTRKEIQLEMLRNAFSVAKLKLRHEIASMVLDNDLDLAADLALAA